MKQSYYSHTPQSKIKSVAINKHAHQSISIGIVFVVVIFVSVIQILLHQRLKQNAPLERLYLVPYSQLKLYLTYISVHVVILMLMLLMISLLMHQPLSILFYLKTLIIVLFYEAGIALLLFKINVLSLPYIHGYYLYGSDRYYIFMDSIVKESYSMIDIQNVSKSYKKKHIFDSLDMQFQNHKITILLGENGAGKSTLLRLIAGIENADEGRIQYFNQYLSRRRIRHIVGYVPQDIALFEHMTVMENIEFFKSLCENPISDETLHSYLSQLNFTDTKVKVSNLSGGNKRKVNIMIGLLSRPKILILDEPTEDIDLESRYDIHNLLQQMTDQCLIIMTTHHLDEVEALADDIKVIGQNPFYHDILENKGWSFKKYANALADNTKS